jgi:hypothetical protein
MRVHVRESHDSISIKTRDENETFVTIKIGRYGYGITGSAYPPCDKGLPEIAGQINAAMSQYLGKTTDLCGCKNYGEFARKIESTIKPAKTWDEVITNLINMKNTATG